MSKCHFAKHQINWFSFTFSKNGVKPIESKTAAIAGIKAPKTLKQLRSFLGSVYHLSEFIPNLAKICHPHRFLLKKVKNLFGPKITKLNLNILKLQLQMLRKKPTLETRVKCDAPRQDIDAELENLDCEGWKTVAFASRFINSNEERDSFNELELLGVVWAIEYFKYYIFGKNFTVFTDHGALLSVLKSHRSNK